MLNIKKLANLVIEKRVFLISFILIIIFSVLAFKNPYNTRTLVPNLEPYPDTLYYSVPAWNFVHGLGFNMTSYGFESKIVTPPVYSLYLLPFFAIFDDVRAFYFANLAVMFGGIIFFVKILEILFYQKKEDLFLIGSLGFFYVTNFYFYTLPSLLMAESITLFFSMLAIYLFISPVSKLKSLLAGSVGILILLIKFSNFPLTMAFYLLYGFKLLQSKETKKFIKPFVTASAISAAVMIANIFSTNIFSNHKNLGGNSGFSSSYFLPNFWAYLRVVFGQNERYLWFSHRLTSTAISIPALFGIFAGHYTKKTRIIVLSLLIYSLALIKFMSFFYTRDIRYILPIYPIMLIFLGFGFQYIKNRFGIKAMTPLLTVLFFFYLLLPTVSQINGERAIITLKKQVGLNFRHAEEPWNYNAVIEFNSYFETKKAQKPYLGTLLPPYYVNYFANGNYNYLPISMGQEFFGDKIDKSNGYLVSLTDYYKKLLKDGNDIYVSPYYQANLISWKTDYETLVSEFDVTLVKSGCHDTCNIYKLNLKSKD